MAAKPSAANCCRVCARCKCRHIKTERWEVQCAVLYVCIINRLHHVQFMTVQLPQTAHQHAVAQQGTPVVPCQSISSPVKLSVLYSFVGGLAAQNSSQLQHKQRLALPTLTSCCRSRCKSAWLSAVKQALRRSGTPCCCWSNVFRSLAVVHQVSQMPCCLAHTMSAKLTASTEHFIQDEYELPQVRAGRAYVPVGSLHFSLDTMNSLSDLGEIASSALGFGSRSKAALV